MSDNSLNLTANKTSKTSIFTNLRKQYSFICKYPKKLNPSNFRFLDNGSGCIDISLDLIMTY